jgi:hypothetical protein
LAVKTAQKPHARVQRSPAIMKVAVPLLQHSQWFGHLALSQTVCSFSSSSSPRVRAKLSEVGSVMRSHSGRRGRLGSVTVIENKLTGKHSTSNIQHSTPKEEQLAVVKFPSMLGVKC